MNEKNFIKLHGTLNGLSRLLLEFNIEFDGFCKLLREYYVREAFKNSLTVTRTSLRVGIDRRIVSAIIKNKKQYQKPSIILTILSRIELLAKNNNMFVNKIGSNSIDGIILEVANGATTLNSVIDELSALGCIKIMGPRIKFLGNKIFNTDEKEKYLLDFSYHLDRYINTFINNLHISNKHKEDHQACISSSRIPTDDQLKLQKETKNILSATTRKLVKLYQSYEQQVPDNTYSEIGVSLHQFNLDPKQENCQ